MQRQHFDIVLRDRLGQHISCAHNLALPRQKHQHVALVFLQRLPGDAREMMLHRFLRARRRMLDTHGETATRAGEARRIQPLRNALAVQRGRHHQQAQIRPQGGLHIECQRCTKIAGKMPLVEFIEQDCTDAGEFRISLNQPCENAFGDYFDARRRTDLRFEADAVADGLSDRFAKLLCHELRRRARRNATRLQHQDFFTREPRRIKQGKWHLRRLAGAGRRFEHEPWMICERRADIRQQRRDRKRGAQGNRQQCIHRCR